MGSCPELLYFKSRRCSKPTKLHSDTFNNLRVKLNVLDMLFRCSQVCISYFVHKAKYM